MVTVIRIIGFISILLKILTIINVFELDFMKKKYTFRDLKSNRKGILLIFGQFFRFLSQSFCA
jgi:hypothetical protein